MLNIEESTRALYERDDLPEELLWINDLTPRHQRLFYGEVQLEWSRYCLTQDADALSEFFEDWRATSEADGSPEHSVALLVDQDEREYDEWPVKAAR